MGLFTGTIGPSFGVSAIYFGSQQPPRFSYSQDHVSLVAPPGAAGPADVYLLAADGGIQYIPAGYSYGPTVLYVFPNAITTAGGTGQVLGYGLGPLNSEAIPSDLQITVGGRPVQITTYYPNAYLVAPKPLPLEAAEFTIPPAAEGSVDVTVTTNWGSTTVHNGMTYYAATQKYPLAGAALAQGIYDVHRDLYYFTDATRIQIFSRTEGTWLAPIILPASFHPKRLWGVSISDDGTVLAVADIGAQAIYLLNPYSPSNAKRFPIPQPAVGPLRSPVGVAVSNAGVIYFTALTTGVVGSDVYFKLDTNTGQMTDYQIESPAAATDHYLRTILSSDGRIAYGNVNGRVFAIDTATDDVAFAVGGPGCCSGNDELALSPNQARFTAGGQIYDSHLAATSVVGMKRSEMLNVSYVYGQKLSPDGTMLFQPGTHGIDVLDTRLGKLVKRIALPVALSPNFDALVSNGTDNALVAITGTNGDGVAVIDLRSLPPVPALPYETELREAGDRWVQQFVQLARIREVSRSREETGKEPPRTTIPHVAVRNLLQRWYGANSDRQ